MLMWLAQDSWSANFVMFKILRVGAEETLEPGSGGGGGRVGGGGGEAARGRGEPVREKCQSWGPSSSRQPLRMMRLPGLKMVTVALLKIILQPWSANGPKPMREWGKEGMTWPDIAAKGRADAKKLLH
jgi:hypothetical protein